MRQREDNCLNTDNVVIIAEAGVNHNGKLDIALKLIEAAAESQADFIKFQTFNPKNIVARNAPLAKYQKINTQYKNQVELLEDLVLSRDDYAILLDKCKECSIGFITTPFDIESLYFVNKLNIPFFKISSGDLLNVPLLRELGQLKKTCILSTGMSNLFEIDFAINILLKEGMKEKDIHLLHCTTEYPCPPNEVNLNAILTMKNSFPEIGSIGYSDHTEGITAPIVAVSLGAKIIEKHFTLDKSMQGPDHKASLIPSELKEMIKQIRLTENYLGSFRKYPTTREIANIDIVRKSIVAKKYIKKGDVLTEDNITVKRPGSGLSSIYWDFAIGTIAIKDFEEDEQICLKR